jgi:hypothetical protein
MHGDKADSKENKKLPNKDHKVSKPTDTGKSQISGAQFHVMGSKYHPGETSDLPKVWTKKKNKRALGMGQRATEPNKSHLEVKRLEGQLENNSFNPNLKKTILGRPGRASPSMAPAQIASHTQENLQSITFVGNMRHDNKHCDASVKPPKPSHPILEKE